MSPRHRSAPTTALTALVAVSGFACSDRTLSDERPVAVGQSSTTFTANQQLDLLFVVDDSNSMKREQQQLAQHFRAMIDVLAQLPGGLPDLHIGVVSTDLGGDAGCDEPSVPGGVLRNAPNPSHDPALDGCMGPSARYLADEVDAATGERRRNYPGALGDAFACIATLGTGGCGFEAPLEATRRALAPTTVENAGFLRPGAVLAVIVISDEDDCSAFDPRVFANTSRVDGTELGARTSFRCFDFGVRCDDGPPGQPGPRVGCEPNEDSPFLTPIEELSDALRAVHPDTDRLIVAGILGAPAVTVGRDDGVPALEASCVLPGASGGGETAFPPVRTDAFLSGFAHHVREPICADDLRPAIRRIGQFIVERLAHCLPPAIDVDPDRDGLQLACVVQELSGPPEAPERHALPPCGDGPPPTGGCWTTAPNPELCITAPEQRQVELRYPGGGAIAADTAVAVSCQSR